MIWQMKIIGLNMTKREFKEPNKKEKEEFWRFLQETQKLILDEVDHVNMIEYSEDIQVKA